MKIKYRLYSTSPLKLNNTETVSCLGGGLCWMFWSSLAIFLLIWLLSLYKCDTKESSTCVRSVQTCSCHNSVHHGSGTKGHLVRICQTAAVLTLALELKAVDLSSSCWDMSVWTELIDWPTDTDIPRASKRKPHVAPFAVSSCHPLSPPLFPCSLCWGLSPLPPSAESTDHH